jgi:hypothetical protein
MLEDQLVTLIARAHYSGQTTPPEARDSVLQELLLREVWSLKGHVYSAAGDENANL